MMTHFATRRCTKRLRGEILETRNLLTGVPIITEFMASNQAVLLDGSSPPESPDWIELYNPGDQSIDLKDWYLTDDPSDLTKWKFPKTPLAAEEYRVVFASGNGNPDRLGNLHTNFRLRASAEYLGLVKPDGVTVVSQFGSNTSNYPAQVTDVSYGRMMTPLQETFVSFDADARFLAPTSEIDSGWTQPNFEDTPDQTEWSFVKSPVGFGSSDHLQSLINSDLESTMRDVSGSSLLRFPFEVADPLAFDTLSFRIAFDDGFAAYLNGRPIAAQHAPDSPTHDSSASDEHEAIGKSFVFDSSQRAVWYSFEDGGGQAITDQLSDDGRQSPLFNSGGSVDIKQERAAFGDRSLRLPGSPGPPNIFNRLQIPDTSNLGNRFTLAAHVNAADRFQRLFSNYNGTGEVAAERILFDFDPTGNAIPGVRLIIGNRGVVQTETVPPQLREDGYHHFAATYEDGAVQLYLDGELIAAGQLGSGPLAMPLDLFLAEDPHDGGGTANEQLSGNLDDVLILKDVVLSPTDLELLARDGAASFFESTNRDAIFETFDVSDHLDALQSGTNTLAIHGLNISADDADFFIAPELNGGMAPERFAPGYFAEPTPAEVNGFPLKGIVQTVRASHQRGFYEKGFELDLTSDTLGATLIYTTDGSQPTTTNGILIEAANPQSAPRARLSIETTTNLRAIAIKEDFYPAAPITHTYVFLTDVLQQPKTPEGLPKRWGRSRADYEMDPEIVNQSPYRETIFDDLQSLPSVSLTIDQEDFFGDSGIYANTLRRGRAWERPVSVEYFDPLNNDQFQIDAGLRVHGGYSREPAATPQHSLRMYFRSEYGEGKLRFPLFSDSDVSVFDSLVLNAQSSDNWTSINITTGRIAQFMRDQWAQDIQREMGQPHVPGKYVHVYINGLYWGLYGLMERPDDDFSAAHFGGTDDEYDVIVDENANSGNLSVWHELLRRSRQQDYEGVSELLDIDNFIDYMIINIFMGNWDWPDHNWNAVRRRAEGEKFKFLIWDAEVGLGIDVNVPGPTKGQVLDVDLAGRRADVGTGDIRNGPGEIYANLKSNPAFRLSFADRLQKHLFNDGALNTSQAAKVYQTRSDEIEAGLVGQAARWGDVRRRRPDVPDGVWADERDWILNHFFVERPAIVLEDFQDETLYPPLSAPEFNQHGGPIPLGFMLAIDHQTDASSVLLTLDGSDPRLANGEIAANAIRYDQPLRIQATTTVKSRAWLAGEWSALNEASFRVESLPGDFTNDGLVNQLDIASMCLAIRTNDQAKDLTRDGLTNHEDLFYLVEQIIGSPVGDVNLDGKFNSTDLVQIFQHGEYEDGRIKNSSWTTGDWNCDGEFDSTDLVFAFQRDGFSR
ncbi:MAG: CotH kinase family protein [Pirellulaceae bacterium]|nr:CotH kinase family protein [Pirellulaceae bacterium]